LRQIIHEDFTGTEPAIRQLIYRNAVPAPIGDVASKFCQLREAVMTAQTRSYPVVDALIDIFGDWLKHRREIREMCDCGSGEFAAIAHDLGVTPDDLDTFVRQGPHAADELPKLLKALGIDETAIARTQPLVLRDMERVCAVCQHKRQCDHDLAAGRSAQHYEEYCGNAATIDALDRKVH